MLPLLFLTTVLIHIRNTSSRHERTIKTPDMKWRFVIKYSMFTISLGFWQSVHQQIIYGWWCADSDSNKCSYEFCYHFRFVRIWCFLIINTDSVVQEISLNKRAGSKLLSHTARTNTLNKRVLMRLLNLRPQPEKGCKEPQLQQQIDAVEICFLFCQSERWDTVVSCSVIERWSRANSPSGMTAIGHTAWVFLQVRKVIEDLQDPVIKLR